MSFKTLAAAAILLLLSGCAAIDEFLFDAYPDGTPIQRGDAEMVKPDRSQTVTSYDTNTQDEASSADIMAAELRQKQAEEEAARIRIQKEQEELLRVQKAAQAAEEARLRAEEQARLARGELWYRINFKSGRTGIDKQTAKDLKKVADKFKEEKNKVRLAVRGYCDAEPIGGYDGKGTSAHKFDSQKELSQARANTVAANLIKHGIPASLISAEGFGATEFITDNNSQEGRDLNRRVDIFLLQR